jgi:hypothetical protein
MKRKDKMAQMFAPSLHKSLRSALVHQILTHFPRIGGDRIGQVCADMILKLLDTHLHPRAHVSHGQILWLAISVDDPPSRGKGIAETDLIPVVLDLVDSSDIHAVLKRVSSHERLQQRCVRLCQQAFEQGGLLSNCDLSLMLHASNTKVSEVLVDYERTRDVIVPRRANLHDMGTGVTHKRIICLKRYRDGKTSDVIARETFHTIESVDTYLGAFDRVRYCHEQGMNIDQTAFAIRCSVNLVAQYLAIDAELRTGEVESDPRREG